ncbi:MAG TPA: transglycosylase SLT domain-containing protein, partial [Vulgatibacter sp.]
AKEAVAILTAVQARLPVLSDRIAWHLALAHERLGEWAKAADSYAAIPESSVLADEARLSQAQALRRLGRHKEALAALVRLREKPAPSWGNDLGAAALFLAGDLHSSLGEKAAAREAWLRVWSEHPLSPQAEDARQRAEAQSREPPSLAQSVRRAQGFLDAQRNHEGVEQIEVLLSRLKLPEPLACEARFALGRGYRKLRQHTKAIATLEPVIESCKDPALRVRALYVLGSSTSIVKPARGVEVYEQLAREHPGHSYADDALVYAADLKARAGDWNGARRELVRLVEEYPDGDFRADALFRLFWIDRAHGRLVSGLGFLQRLEEDYRDAPGSVDLERSLYWQARTLSALRRDVEAVVAYENLLRRHPASYYSVLARGRLAQLQPALAKEIEARLAPPPTAPRAASFSKGPLADEPRFRTAVELLRLGFPKAATDELLRIDRKALRGKAGSGEPVVLLAWLLDRADSRRAAHQIARTELREFLRGGPRGEGALHFRIAYPLAFRDLVEKHATAAKVPPDLLQALMREESSLDPDIVSWAGAVGLTQLMPSTAQQVANRLKLGKIAPSRLREPDLNVRIGAAYLGSLLERWGGNPALACASYNAGPGAVARWLAERGDMELDEFVEEIPIEETRNYVKRVLESYGAYRLTYGAGETRFVSLKPAKARPGSAR